MSLHPITFVRPPDRSLYETDFFDNNWEAKTNMNAYGAQAFFDVYADGSTANGRRITFNRSALIGDRGNGATVAITVSTTLALTWTAATRVLGGTIIATTTLAQLAAAIRALTGTPFGVSDIGTGAGTVDGDGYAGAFAGGTPDPYGWVEVVNVGTQNNGGLIASGTSTPTDTTSPIPGAAVVPRYGTRGRMLLPGETLYTLRQGTNDIPGSAELWLITEGEQAFFGI